MDQIIINGRYRHYKGNEYRVLHLARHSETLEDMVVYQAFTPPHEVWVRPAAMWGEEIAEGLPRFAFLGVD